ncbi:vWA domain-containing protein [Haloglomus salinum]|uniref:vWA domain-containing protein n=1 Tax=Haloglomus salinum TaxID=2962673 RepID=UPI0020C972BB|nr:VWA domain-containing protein [Haloglomus salinum]
MRRVVLAVATAALLVTAGCSGVGGPDGGGFAASGGGSVGLAAGGAQDAHAFRENIDAGYVPQPTDMTAAGLYHDYYFDTGNGSCDRTFCPSASPAVSRDPLSNETEYFTTVGLNSGISQAAFERPKLNLVVVVDTSGSMSDEMRRYYYDGEGGTPSGESPETVRKMQAAKQAVETMTDRLNASDRVGIVAYDDSARVVQELQRVDEAGEERLDERIDSLRADGGTNLDDGMRTAVEMAQQRADPESDRATRIVYVTDAMPNTGQTDEGALEERLGGHAANGIHSTFVGVGVDFNSRLVEQLNAVEGANHYTVRSAEAFRERMDEGFQYMVTPLVYDLRVQVQSDGMDVARVHGTPDANATSGEVMHVTTLFPSRREGNRTEGSVTLVELEPTGDGPRRATLVATYRTRDGERHRTTRTVDLRDREPEFFATTGVRKAVALARYAELGRSWAAYERRKAAGRGPTTPAEGDGIPALTATGGSEWEQRSLDLQVSPVYRTRFDRFADYFAREKQALRAERMQRDLDIVRTLANGTRAGTPTVTPGEPGEGVA